MPGLSSDEKSEARRMSYRDYLLNVVKADPASSRISSNDSRRMERRHDAVGALEVWPSRCRGFDGLKLDPGPAPRMGVTAPVTLKVGRTRSTSRW